MRSSGTFRIPAGVSPCSGEMRLRMAGDRSRSSASLRAAVPRKSGLAKFDHLPCQPTVCAGRLGVACVGSYGSANERCLAEANRLPNHVLEDVVVPQIAHLLEHVATEDRAAVVESRQQPEHLKTRVQALGADLSYDVHQGG